MSGLSPTHPPSFILIPFPWSSPPLSLALTRFHALLLFPDKFVAVNLLSTTVAATQHLARLGVGPPSPPGAVALSLVPDAPGGALYLTSSDGLYEVSCRDEGRSQWRIHASRSEWAPALAAAPNQAAKQRVRLAAGDAAWAAGDLAAAAGHWAAAPGAVRFERAALAFLSSRDPAAPAALRAYLTSRLDGLGKGERAAATLLATWLLESHLHACASSAAAAPSPPADAPAPDSTGDAAAASPPPPPPDAAAALVAFLRAHHGSLDGASASRLLSELGTPAQQLLYAELRGDAAACVRCHLAARDAAGAVAVLRRPTTDPEVAYACASRLFAIDPQLACRAWASLVGARVLSADRLVPALSSAASSHAHPASVEAATKLLERAAATCAQPACVHNLLLQLYASSPGGHVHLLRHIRSAVHPTSGAPMYDAAFALRVCASCGATSAAAELHCAAGDLEAAVDAAIAAGDLPLARRVASTPTDDSQRRRALWLRLGAAAVASSAGTDASDPAAAPRAVAAAMECVAESDGCLRLEDLLPLVPPSTCVDDFRAAVLASLDDHAEAVAALKAEVDDAVSAATSLEAEISALATRTLTLPHDAVCARCAAPLATLPPPPGCAAAAGVPAFVCFPCGHSFCASGCVLDAAAPWLGAPVLTAAKAGWAACVDGGRGAAAGRRAWEGATHGECPLCGEAAAAAIARPLVDSEAEAVEVAAWAV